MVRARGIIIVQNWDWQVPGCSFNLRTEVRAGGVIYQHYRRVEPLGYLRGAALLTLPVHAVVPAQHTCVRAHRDGLTAQEATSRG